jgi:hypothetical protein
VWQNMAVIDPGSAQPGPAPDPPVPLS